MLKEGYKKSDIGVIPEDWEVKTLGDIGEFKNGLNKGKEDFGFGYRFVNIQNAYTGEEVDIGKLERINATKDEAEIYGLKKGDIVLVRSSVKPTGVGYPILYNGEDEIVVYCGFMIRYRYDIKKYNPRYMLYQLRGNKARKKVLDLSTVSANTNINQESLKIISIPIPPLKEQERIAEILSTVDCQIDDTRMLVEKCRVLKKGLMQRLLSKGIGHCEFKDSEVGEIPVGWEVLGFFDFVERIIDFRGRTPKKLGLDWGGGDILALSANNVKMGNIDFTIENYFASNELYEKWMLGSELCKNDILMTMEAPLGNVALVPDNKKYILSQRVVALKTKEFINNEFMLYMIMSDIIQNQLNMLSTGTTAKGINQKNLAKVKVVIPTLEEQEKIAQILSSVDNQIEEYENKKQQLEELKKGLMQQLLIGKIRTV